MPNVPVALQESGVFKSGLYDTGTLTYTMLSIAHHIYIPDLYFLPLMLIWVLPIVSTEVPIDVILFIQPSRAVKLHICS